MRYALVSDIHANIQGWNAVLKDIRAQGVDAILCLGDVVGYGPNPAEVLESCHKHIDYFILGNHDAVVGNRMDSELFNDNARFLIEWTREQLNDASVKFFNEMPLQMEGETFACAHAELAIPGRFSYLYNPDDCISSFDANKHPIMFVGHTHLPAKFTWSVDNRLLQGKNKDFDLKSGERYLINVGSVGDPRDGFTNAHYCIYDEDRKSVIYRKVPFDIEAFKINLAKAQLPIKPYFVMVDEGQVQENETLKDMKVVKNSLVKPGKKIHFVKKDKLEETRTRRMKVNISFSPETVNNIKRNTVGNKNDSLPAKEELKNSKVVLLVILLLLLVGGGAGVFMMIGSEKEVIEASEGGQKETANNSAVTQQETANNSAVTQQETANNSAGSKQVTGHGPAPTPIWIWHKSTSENQTVNFKKTFKIEGELGKAFIRATCDNTCKIKINGKLVASSNDWKEVIRKGVTKFLKQGENEVFVEATNEDGVAGFVFLLKHSNFSIISDKTWLTQGPGEKWGPAKELDRHGAMPWGNILQALKTPNDSSTADKIKSSELKKGLVHNFPLGSKNLADSVNTSIVLKASGSVTPVKRLTNFAIRLDGSGLSSDKVGSYIDYKTPFSFGGWFRINDLKGFKVPFARMEKEPRYRGFDLFVEDAQFGTHLSHDWKGKNAIKVISLNKLKPKQWNHLFITYNGTGKASGLKLYLNGVETKYSVEMDSLSKTIKTNVPFRLGSREDLQYFRGLYDDIYIFNRVLNFKEIKQLGSTP